MSIFNLRVYMTTKDTKKQIFIIFAGDDQIWGTETFH